MKCSHDRVICFKYRKSSVSYLGSLFISSAFDRGLKGEERAIMERVGSVMEKRGFIERVVCSSVRTVSEDNNCF